MHWNMHGNKKKAEEEAVEHKHGKKAVCEMDEIVRLERMREHHKHDVHHGPCISCMSVEWASSITSTTDNARNLSSPNNNAHTW